MKANNGVKYLAIALIDRQEKQVELEKQIEFTAGHLVSALEKTKKEIKDIEQEICSAMNIGNKVSVKNHVCDYVLEIQKGRTNVGYKGVVDEIKLFIKNKYKRLERLIDGLLEKHTSVSKKVVVEKISEAQGVEQQSLLQ